MPTPLKNAIVISANCYNSSASGDYQIAGQLAYSFITELNGSSEHSNFQSIATLADQEINPQPFEIILLTTRDRLDSFTRLYGERNSLQQVKVNDVFIKLHSEHDFPLNDYHVSGYISANPCRPMPQSSLKNILSPDTQSLFVYGPHHPDVNASSLNLFHFAMELSSKVNSAFSYMKPKAETLGFITDGGHRLGLFPMTKASGLSLTDSENAKFQAVFQPSEYAPVYLNTAKQIEPEIKEFIELATPMTKNFIFFGNYAAELKTLLRRLPYSVSYDIGGARGQINKLQFEINIKHFRSIEHNVFRKLMAGGIPLVVASGVNSVQETLSDGRIVYLQDLELNQIFIDSYLQSLTRYCTTFSTGTASENKEAVNLASLLMKPKPLMPADKQRVKRLLAKPEVMTLLQKNNQSLLQASQASISKKLLPNILRENTASMRDQQLRQALAALKKVNEVMNPSLGQALRRAAGLPNKLFELKILIAHCKRQRGELDSVVADKKITALHYAVQSGRFDNMLLLLRAGSNMNLRDYKGRNPAYYAASHGHDNCLSTLISFGANITNCSSDGKSALEICRSSPELKRHIENATPKIDEHSAVTIQTQFRGFFTRKRQVPMPLKKQETVLSPRKKARIDGNENSSNTHNEEASKTSCESAEHVRSVCLS